MSCCFFYNHTSLQVPLFLRFLCLIVYSWQTVKHVCACLCACPCVLSNQKTICERAADTVTSLQNQFNQGRVFSTWAHMQFNHHIYSLSLHIFNNIYTVYMQHTGGGPGKLSTGLTHPAKIKGMSWPINEARRIRIVSSNLPVFVRPCNTRASVLLPRSTDPRGL